MNGHDTAEALRRGHLAAILEAGLAAVQADACLPRHLPQDRPPGRTVLFALGKAAGQMARSALAQCEIDAGLIVTRYGHMPSDYTPPPHTVVIESGHPDPDEASLRAGAAAIALADSLGHGDRLLALVSGGGSALLAAPIEGLAFAQKQAINRALLASGAPIESMNRVRAAMSRIKGGKLAQLAHPAEVLTYVISDVPRDDPALVASGPTCPLPPGEDALKILARYRIPVAQDVAAILARAHAGWQSAHVTVCARASDALAAMAQTAAQRGYTPVMLGDAIEGDAQMVARAHAGLALEASKNGRAIALISGGETHVVVAGSGGRGGRNQTYALALAAALDGAPGISALAVDSDGIDGTSAAAGAVVHPSTLARARARGLCARHSLAMQDSSGFFAAIGDLVMTGPTGTNVNDLRVTLIDRLSDT